MREGLGQELRGSGGRRLRGLGLDAQGGGPGSQAPVEGGEGARALRGGQVQRVGDVHPAAVPGERAARPRTGAARPWAAPRTPRARPRPRPGSGRRRRAAPRPSRAPRWRAAAPGASIRARARCAWLSSSRIRKRTTTLMSSAITARRTDRSALPRGLAAVFLVPLGGHRQHRRVHGLDRQRGLARASEAPEHPVDRRGFGGWGAPPSSAVFSSSASSSVGSSTRTARRI